MHDLIDWLVDFFEAMGYPGIVVAVFCAQLTAIYAWRHRRCRSAGAGLKVL